MASMFPPNLDDGERWLPAEIIPDVIGAHQHLHRHRSRHIGVDRFILEEELAGHIAALVLNPTRPAVRSQQPELQGFRTVSNGYGSAYINGLRVPSAGSLGGTGAFLPLSGAQVREEGRARVLPRNGPARFMPGRINGPGKDSGGGTGVFLPRVVYNDVQKKPKEANGYDGEQQQKQRQKRHLQQAIRFAAAAAAAAATEVKQQQLVMAPPIPAAEVTLPQEWTY